jgi:hypothetical protein
MICILFGPCQSTNNRFSVTSLSHLKESICVRMIINYVIVSCTMCVMS